MTRREGPDAILPETYAYVGENPTPHLKLGYLRKNRMTVVDESLLAAIEIKGSALDIHIIRNWIGYYRMWAEEGEEEAFKTIEEALRKVIAGQRATEVNEEMKKKLHLDKTHWIR